jgi:hypothetical protein
LTLNTTLGRGFLNCDILFSAAMSDSAFIAFQHDFPDERLETNEGGANCVSVSNPSVDLAPKESVDITL